MANNLHNLSEAERKVIAESPEICNFLVAAFGLQEKMLNYVRHATTVTQAKQRAGKVKNGITVLLVKLAPPTAIQPQVVLGASDLAEDATPDMVRDALFTAREQANAMYNAGYSIQNLCHPPKHWDPVTETCV